MNTAELNTMAGSPFCTLSKREAGYGSDYRPPAPALYTPAVQWLPMLENFREELRAAQAPGSAAQTLERFARLSDYRLGLIETMQLDRALGRIGTAERGAFPTLRLALLSSSTVAHLLPAVRTAALRRRLLIDAYAGGYGQYRHEILDDASPLHEFRPEVIVFSIAAREAIAGVSVGATADEADRALEQAVTEVRRLWRAARDKHQAAVIQQTFLNTAEPLFGSFERRVAGAPMRLIERLNDLLGDAAAADGVALLDIAAAAAARAGLDAWHDATSWLSGKMEVAPRAAPMYGELLMRVVGAQRGLSKKCLVLDLDNTLWGGVVGDDGIEGLVLGEGSAVGEAHSALQTYAMQLKQRGIVLAVCSKNDPGLAAQAFREHPEMVLRLADIACFVANWAPKADNLRSIALSLNLGLDSMVFVDDNPAERAAVRAALPMVAVPEMPPDASQYVRCLAEAGYFEAVAFTPEDRQRSAQYAANAQRSSALQSSAGVADFLEGLKMSTQFGPIGAMDVARAAQLINKTNQFNPTTARYSQDEVARICADPTCLTLQFRLKDRFGDNGIVSVMILRRSPREPEIFCVDTWVMSCRVFGRELEYEAMSIAVETMRRAGASKLRAVYVPTQKNAVVKDLYANLGFVPDASEAAAEVGVNAAGAAAAEANEAASAVIATADTADTADTVDAGAGGRATHWLLPLDEYQPRATYIERIAAVADMGDPQ